MQIKIKLNNVCYLMCHTAIDGKIYVYIYRHTFVMINCFAL